MEEKSLPDPSVDGVTGRLPSCRTGCSAVGTEVNARLFFLFHVKTAREGLDFSLLGQLIQRVADLTGIKTGSFLQPLYGDAVSTPADHPRDAVQHGLASPGSRGC